MHGGGEPGLWEVSDAGMSLALGPYLCPPEPWPPGYEQWASASPSAQGSAAPEAGSQTCFTHVVRKQLHQWTEVGVPAEPLAPEITTPHPPHPTPEPHQIPFRASPPFCVRLILCSWLPTPDSFKMVITA